MKLTYKQNIKFKVFLLATNALLSRHPEGPNKNINRDREGSGEKEKLSQMKMSPFLNLLTQGGEQIDALFEKKEHSFYTCRYIKLLNTRLIFSSITYWRAFPLLGVFIRSLAFIGTQILSLNLIFCLTT